MVRWRNATWLVVANLAVWLVLGYAAFMLPDAHIEAESEGMAVSMMWQVKIMFFVAAFALSSIVVAIIWFETQPDGVRRRR